MTGEDSTRGDRNRTSGAQPGREPGVQPDGAVFGVLERRVGLLGFEPADAPPGTTGRTDVLPPFTGVLGPWRPAVDELPLRLSFLALPWLVREVHTTERVVPEERRPGSPLPGDATPETTTASRLLRAGPGAEPPFESDEPSTSRSGDAIVGPTSQSVKTLREVLRWRPVLVDRPARPGERDRTAHDGTAASTPFGVPTTLRTIGDRGRPDASGAGREAGRPPGRGGHEVSSAPARGVRRPTVGFAPARSGTGVLGGHDRPRLGDRSTTRGVTSDDEPGVRSPSRTGVGWGREYGTSSHDTPGPVGRFERPELTFAERPVTATVTDGRPDGTGPGTRSPSSPGAPVDAGAGRGTLTYHRVGVGPPETSQSRGLDGLASPRAADSDRGSPTRNGDTRPSHDTGDTPSSPFASFPDTEAAIDHVYHEIERRWRIERERRGR